MQFVQLHMTRDRPSEWDIPINSPQSAYEALKRLIGNLDSENCVALMLDIRGNVNYFYNFARGTLNSSLMHPREVFKAAILSNSNSIILAHNHPSGDLRPSPEDIDVTKRLVRAGRTLGIPVQDHVLVSDTNYYSMRENNTLRFGASGSRGKHNISEFGASQK